MAKSPRTAPRTGVAGPNPAYDAVVKGGRVIDPANNRDGVFDIGIRKGRIAAIAERLGDGAATRVIDAGGLIVTPGLIDTHAHVYEHVSGDFGLNPDLVGVRSGVTTVIDQGGPSALTFDGFRKFIVEPAKTRVLAFISAYLAGGLLGHRYVDLYGPVGINVKAIVKSARDNSDLVRGIKAHAEPGGYSRWGMAALKLAKEASREVKLPVYIHLGTLWPELDGAKVDPATIIDEVVPLLDPGDILAHPFTRFPSGFVGRDGRVHPLIRDALAKGVRIDVGRGAHFSFTAARRVLGAGILPFTIGADLHGYNVRIADGGRAYRGMFTGEGVDSIVADDRASPFSRPYSLQHAMSELLALGVPLAETIRMATQNAAIMLGLEAEMGALSIGMPADMSVMRMLEGEWELVDSERVTHTARQLLHPEFAIRGGKVHQADSPLLPAMAALAAPAARSGSRQRSSTSSSIS
ncbi:MAG TPA: amidohydrolase/deacetylase family metallohydrolase [Stellaceae bacterium]|nr:amidohydrolase/deacetylase family metallohydrolase [Stellaceae bacterium]